MRDTSQPAFGRMRCCLGIYRESADGSLLGSKDISDALTALRAAPTDAPLAGAAGQEAKGLSIRRFTYLSSSIWGGNYRPRGSLYCLVLSAPCLPWRSPGDAVTSRRSAAKSSDSEGMSVWWAIFLIIATLESHFLSLSAIRPAGLMRWHDTE